MKPTGEMEVRTRNIQKHIENGEISEAQRLMIGYAREIGQLVGEKDWLVQVEVDWRHDTTMMRLFHAQYILNKKWIEQCLQIQSELQKILWNKQ